MEIVRSLNRNWIDDAYFSLYRPIHPGEKSGGEMSGGKCPDTLETNHGSAHLLRLSETAFVPVAGPSAKISM